MSLIGLLGRSGAAFVGGAAGQFNVLKDQQRKAEAELDLYQEQTRIQGQEWDRQFGMKTSAEIATEMRAADREKKKAEADAEKQKNIYDNRLKGTIDDFRRLSTVETEEQPVLMLGGEFPEIQFVKTPEKGMTEDQVVQIASRGNRRLKDAGYIMLPVPRDDGKGWKTELKEIKGIEDSNLFKTGAEAEDFAQKRLSYYDGLGVEMVPFFKTTKDGIEVTFNEKSVADTSEFMFDNEEDARKFAEDQMAWYESRSNLKGTYEPRFETTKDGIKVSFMPLSKEQGAAGDGPAKSEQGYVYDTNYKFKISPKVGGPEIAEKQGGKFEVGTLTGNRVARTGVEQKDEVEGRDYFVFQKQGIGDNATERVESLATGIQRDFTPEVLNKLLTNKGTTAGGNTHRAMLSVFRTFVNTYKEASTTVTDNQVVQTPIEDRHPWLEKYAEADPDIAKILKNVTGPDASSGSNQALLMPINEPVTKTVDGIVKNVRPNLSAPESGFVMMVPDPNNPDQERPAYTQNFLTQSEKIVRDTGVGQVVLYNILDSAVNPVDGTSTPAASQQAFAGIANVRTQIQGAGPLVSPESGQVAFSIPGMDDTMRTEIMSELNRFSSPNNAILAMQAALPVNASRAAIGKLKDNSSKGRFDAVTGGATKFTVVGEQLDNAEEMMGSINGLEKALVADRATGEQGEVGLVLSFERMQSGAEYLLESVIKNIPVEEGINRNEIYGDLRSQLNRAVQETDTEKKNNALVKLYSTMLSYQLARLMDPNGRLSDEDRRTIEDGMGVVGFSANPDAILALTSSLKGKVAYIQARNQAYVTGNINRVLAAHLFDEVSQGGNFKAAFNQVFEVGADTRGQGGAGATFDPAFQRLLEIQERQNQTTGETPTGPTSGPTDLPVT